MRELMVGVWEGGDAHIDLAAGVGDGSQVMSTIPKYFCFMDSVKLLLAQCCAFWAARSVYSYDNATLDDCVQQTCVYSSMDRHLLTRYKYPILREYDVGHS